METDDPKTKIKKTMVYTVLPRTSSSFELRFADLRAYEKEISASGRCTATAEYSADGTLVTRITSPVANQESVVTTNSQPVKLFGRVEADDKCRN